MKHLQPLYAVSALLLATACPAAELAAPRPWLAFDRYEQYRPSFYSGKGKLENVSGGVRLTGDARTFVLRDRKFLIHSHNSPQAALFDCELASSNPVKVVISGTADGKPFRSAPAELRPGMKQLRVELGKPGLLAVSGLEILNPGGKLDLTLRRAALEYSTNPAQALLVAPALPSRLAILNPGEPVRLSVTNPTAETISFTIDGKLTHFYGKALPFRAEQKLAPGQSVTVSVPGQPALNGHWQLDWTVRSGSDAATGKAGLAILPALPAYQAKPDDFKFGVCSHPGRWAEGERELEAQATARIGAAYVRTGVDWSNIQPTAAPPDYRLFDSVVDLFARHGIETQGMFGFCARWAAPESTRNAPKWQEWNRAKPDLDAWKSYVEATARHFQGRIRIWEIWNEPDLHAFSHFSAADYVDLARVAHATVKAVDPGLTVFSAGFAGLSPHPGRRDPDYQYKVMRDGKQYFDVHAYHGHSNYATYARQIDERLLPLREKAGVTIPWYANETAVSAIGGTEREQASALFKKLLFSWSRGAIGYNWYDLRNDGFTATDPEHHFGLLTHDFQAKPVLSVYHTLARCFRGARFERNLELPEGCVGFEFSNGPDRLLAVWNEADTATGPIPVLTDARRAERIDLMGNAVNQPLAAGLTLLDLTAAPAILRLENAKRAELKPELISFESGAVVPGQPFALTLTLANPTGKAADFKLAFRPKKGITLTPAETTVHAAPGQKQVVTVNGKAAADSRPDRVRLAYSLAGTPFHGEFDVPLRAATRIPAGDGNYRRKPDFRLDRPAQVVSYCEGDPSKRHLVWQGPEDLSAGVYLRKDAEELEIYTAVTDDVHVQPATGTDIWQGDSIQFALTIPGQNGSWKIGLARLANGRAQTFVWEAPTGFDPAAATDAIRLTTFRDDKAHRTAYRARLKLDAFGLTEQRLRDGIRFNLLINDNDGELREGFIQIAPGISEWKNFEKFPLIVFE